MTEPTISKGYVMEEGLRKFFLDSNFYVVRGLKYNFQTFDITDVDLWLYSKSSPIGRHRTIVDIKNKKTPQAIERIFWTKGLKEVLGVEACIVCTTDDRKSVSEFGRLNNVNVLDGLFITKYAKHKDDRRYTEEEFFGLISKGGLGKLGVDWRNIYEGSKSRLISKLDFGGIVEQLNDIKYFLEQIVISSSRQEAATRLLYGVLSHFVITFDFLQKDYLMLEVSDRVRVVSEGIRYGNLGKAGIDRVVGVLSFSDPDFKRRIGKNFEEMFKSIPVHIVCEYLCKNDVAKSLVDLANELEFYTYSKTYVSPEHLSLPLQSLISVLLDYNAIDRRRFFKAFSNTASEKQATIFPEKLADSEPPVDTTKD